MARYRLFKFKHPKTNEIFSDFRDVRDADRDFLSPDGVVCEPYGVNSENNHKRGVIVKDGEGFERYPGYYKEMNPKFVRYRDGHREPYDPNRHC